MFGGIELPKAGQQPRAASVAELAGSAARPQGQAKVEVNVTEVAKSLNLDT